MIHCRQSKVIFAFEIRDELPSIEQAIEIDGEVLDQDKIWKEKGREYADAKRRAKPSEIKEGDEVWLKNITKKNNLTPTFEPIPHRVVEKKGAELIIENMESKVQYRRNVSHALKAVSTKSWWNRSYNFRSFAF